MTVRMNMSSTHFLHEVDMTHKAPPRPPNCFPPGHRLSKANRRIRLGRMRRGTKHLTVFVLVIDEVFGVCPLAIIEPYRIKTDPRTGKSWFNLCTDYPAENVVVHTVWAYKMDAAGRLKVMADLHKMIVNHKHKVGAT